MQRLIDASPRTDLGRAVGDGPVPCAPTCLAGFLPHWGMPRAGLKAVLVMSVLLLASCGNDDDGGTTETATSADGGWWLLDAPEFNLVDGGLADAAIAESTGQRWVLEYSNGLKTLQLQGWDSESEFVSLAQEDLEVGSDHIAGFDAVLRQGPGIPSKDIAPSVGAMWTDGDVFIVFGGGALTEKELRGFLGDLRRVSRDDWEAAATTIP